MRGPIISTKRSKQTPVRGPAPPHPPTSGVIRVPYPIYGSFGSKEVYPNPRISKEVMLDACLNYAFENAIFRFV
jgi:hypothetical protein